MICDIYVSAPISICRSDSISQHVNCGCAHISFKWVTICTSILSIKLGIINATFAISSHLCTVHTRTLARSQCIGHGHAFDTFLFSIPAFFVLLQKIVFIENWKQTLSQRHALNRVSPGQMYTGDDGHLNVHQFKLNYIAFPLFGKHPVWVCDVYTETETSVKLLHLNLWIAFSTAVNCWPIN